MRMNLQRLVKRPLVTEWCLDEEDDGDRRLGGGDGLPLVETLQTYSALQKL